MIHTAPLFAIQFANPQNAIPHVLSQKTLFAMLNVKNQNAKLNALIKDAKCLTAQNALPYAKHHIALLTAKHQNQNVKLYAKNQNATGNATNHNVQNQNAS